MAAELISVIVPAYNQGLFLAECLNSLLAQTYLNWECIIIDDGSTDNTAEIAKDFRAADTRFNYVHKQNGGVATARNNGLEFAKGTFIKFLDADDWLVPTCLEKSILDSSKHDLVICNFNYFLQEENKSSEASFQLPAMQLSFEEILLYWDLKFDIPIHAALINRRLLQNFSFNTDLKIYEDWVMWLHIFKQSPAVAMIDEVLATYRKWPHSATKNDQIKLENEFYAFQYVIKHFDLGNEHSRALNKRFVNDMTDTIKQLQGSYAHIKNSTSYKASLFIITGIRNIQRILAGKQK